jgi:hypothetical protein
MKDKYVSLKVPRLYKDWRCRYLIDMRIIKAREKDCPVTLDMVNLEVNSPILYRQNEAGATIL